MLTSLQDDMMTSLQDDMMTSLQEVKMITCYIKNLFQIRNYESLTDSLTRVKSRDASASKKGCYLPAIVHNSEIAF